jgi:hypothetical protein
MLYITWTQRSNQQASRPPTQPLRLVRAPARRACLLRARPRSRSHPAPAVSPHVLVPRRTPNATCAHAFRACACGSSIFWDFAAHLAIFAIMAQSIFDFVSHFWFLVHSLSVTQSFFRFRQPFLRFCHTLNHFCYNGSVIFWISSAFFEMSSMRF